MADNKWIHGSTVVDGVLRYLSPSGMKLADMSTDQGCARKWYYAYVEGKKEPQTRQQAEGQADHSRVERFLETGERTGLSPRVAKGLHMLPPPGPHLTIEHDMVPTLLDAEGKAVSGLHLAPLKVEGIPIVGRIDLMHDLAQNFGADSVEETRDPEGTVEVADHKFTGRLDYAKKGPELVKDIQMVAYGEYVYTVIPEVKRLRLSHYYYPTNGNAKKATILTDKETIDRYWMEHVHPLVRSIKDYAKEPTADTVPGNTRACRAFNRECMHATYCKAGMQAALSSLVGQTAAQGLINDFSKTLKQDAQNTMALVPGKSLLAHIKKTPAATATTDKEAELAKLKAEEAAAKLAALVEKYGPVLNAIRTYDKGLPQITGKAAEVYAKVYGGAPTANGALADVAISEPEEFDTLLAELAEAFGTPTPDDEAEIVTKTPGRLPADVTVSVGLVPDDAPDSVPAVTTTPATTTPATTTPTPVETTAEATPEPEAKKARAPRGSKKAASATPEATPTAPAATAPAPAEPSMVESPKVEASADTKVVLYIDTVMDGAAAKPFAPIVDTCAEALAKRFNLDDCRLGDSQSPIGFGKWKGALAAMLRDEMPKHPGVYHIDARGNEIYEEAVQAMRDVCRRTGGFTVRGAR